MLASDPHVCLLQDRKCIIKTMKGNVVKICQEEFGHLVLLAVFDCVDDTKLVKLALLDVCKQYIHWSNSSSLLDVREQYIHWSNSS